MAEPVVFVDVSHADPEPPKRAKYYSNKNSRAANPDADTDSNQPKLTGKQTDVPKTEDTPRLNKLQPSPPKESTAETKPTEKTEAASPMNLGDVRQAKPADGTAAARQPEQPPKRPRTLKEALAQQQLPGQQMRQDGGVQRRAQASLDAKAVSYGQYTKEFIDTINQRFWNLLYDQKFANNRSGRVKIHFKLNYDGSISNMEILENTAGFLCGYIAEKSVFDNEPFRKWPKSMRSEIGDSIDCEWTCDY